MKNGDYTQEEDVIITRMRSEGNKNHGIALRLDRSLDSIKGRARYLIKKGLIKSRGTANGRYPEGRKLRKWTDEDIKKFKQLRGSGKPYAEIAKELGRTVDAIQQTAIRLMRKDDTLSSRNTPTDTKIYNLNSELAKIGLMLWWAEGTKGGHSVQFVNSSPDMIKVYMRFLREIGADISRLRVRIKVMNSSQVEECQGYWSKVAKIPINNFTKPIVRGKKIDDAYKEHKGCLTITYFSSNLKRQMEAKIDEIKEEILKQS
ncbi:MAG: hypothetical protein L6243_07395 [Candidatus Altiarchaeales archaeon]|nr:hypothetical protein [Candidatus Altiarchaeota archaeon]MBU4266555.1 hypothetical protein [Candidatus Altiarchaeota archaeon]MBU4341718.1 hypothetical protein [Candidatus Altiarchaeota archaeon]MCG2783395.1 hypothetical protein [Candidatus Altiarchaeales archaeon]